MSSRRIFLQFCKFCEKPKSTYLVFLYFSCSFASSDKMKRKFSLCIDINRLDSRILLIFVSYLKLYSRKSSKLLIWQKEMNYSKSSDETLNMKYQILCFKALPVNFSNIWNSLCLSSQLQHGLSRKSLSNILRLISFCYRLGYKSKKSRHKPQTLFTRLLSFSLPSLVSLNR